MKTVGVAFWNFQPHMVLLKKCSKYNRIFNFWQIAKKCNSPILAPDFDTLKEVWLKSDKTVEGVVFWKSWNQKFCKVHGMTPNQTQGMGHQKYPTYLHCGTPTENRPGCMQWFPRKLTMDEWRDTWTMTSYMYVHVLWQNQAVLKSKLCPCTSSFDCWVGVSGIEEWSWGMLAWPSWKEENLYTNTRRITIECKAKFKTCYNSGHSQNLNKKPRGLALCLTRLKTMTT